MPEQVDAPTVNPQMQELMQQLSEFRAHAKTIEGKAAEQEIANDKFEKTLDKIQAINSEATIKELEAQNEVKALKDSLELVEKKLSRMHIGNSKTVEVTETQKAFEKFLRVGCLDAHNMTREEKSLLTTENVMYKRLRTDSLTEGQVFATPEFTNEIIKNVKEITPVMSLVRVTPTNKTSLVVRVRIAAPSFGSVGEGQSGKTSNSKYGTKTIKNGIVRGKSEATEEMLSDSDINIESEITLDMAEDFAFHLGNGFVLGNTGENEMQGFLNKAEIQTVDIVGGEITSDSIIELFGELKTDYKNASYLFNRRTLSFIMRLVDGNGRYLWQPSLAVGAPSLLNGIPYVEAPDMPDQAVGERPIALGDWFRAYRVVNGTGMTMIRDRITEAESGIVKFIGSRRQGGLVVLDEAIKIMNITT